MCAGEQHPPVKARGRREVSTWQWSAHLLLHRFLPRQAGAAAKRAENFQISCGECPNADLGDPHRMGGMPSGISIDGTPVVARAFGSTPASTFPQAVP